jgi:hypothetical protein
MAVERRANIIRAESVRIRDLVARTLQIVVAAKELLSRPVPDTFIGRRTYEPFPTEDKAEHLKANLTHLNAS